MQTSNKNSSTPAANAKLPAGAGNNKTSTSPAPTQANAANGGMPAWAKVGSDAYNKMNTTLQTAPMNAAVTGIQNGGMTAGTKQDVNTLGQIAKNGGTNGNIDWAANFLKNAAGQNVDTSQLQGILNGMQNPGTVSAQNYQNVYDKAGQAGANEQYLSGTASGSMLENNPYIDKMVQNAENDVADQTNRMFAAGGRYGSAAHQGTLADSLAKTSNDLRFNNYNQERDRQLNAANAISGEQGNRLGLQGNAASGVAGIEGTNIGNQMQSDVNRGNIAQTIAGIQGNNIDRGTNAASSVGNIGQNQITNKMNAATSGAGLENQGIQNVQNFISQLPTIQQNKTYDADKQASIGSGIDQMSQGQLDDLMNQFSQYDMKDWAKLGGLLSAGTTAAGNWGTSTSKQSTPMNILGTLGTIFSGINWSDESIKKNVKEVGVTKGGNKVVSYDLNDKGKKMADKAGNPKRKGLLGVIAQDVAEKQPEAVKKDKKTGLLAVDYSKLC
jgi:hypothetical protein